MFATGPWPWLKCEIDASGFAGRWVRLVYAGGLLERSVRPVLRVFAGDAFFDQFLPAATLGRAIWIGRIPEGARDIWISPTNRPGPFAFRLERWELISNARLLAMIYIADPWRGGKFLWASLADRARFAELQARRALGRTPLAEYHSWRRARERRFEPEGFDAPAPGGPPAPRFRLVVRAGAPKPAKSASRAKRLRSRPCPDGSVVYLGDPAAEPEPERWVRADAPFAELTRGLEPGDFLLSAGPDDILADHAFAVLAEAARRTPEADVLYADEDGVDLAGRRRDPKLKPDWSPIFQAAAPYLGAAVAVKVEFAIRAMSSLASPTASDWPAIDASARVEHVRRILLTRPLAPRDETPRRGARAAEARGLRAESRACVIIPTRDRRDLLEKCLASLEARAAGASFEVLVVDNGSAEPETLAYLEALGRARDRRVLRSPGPFNFSRLCNLASRETRAPFLVFLNNDVEAASEGWLRRMLELAARPEVGAVGAKLLYGDETVQHAGVVLGVDGKAGHVQRGVSADDPGYLNALAAPREVGAVTAACLAVEASKFAEVGGFDEDFLPVESNDVDLCLRLAERGWKSVCEPRSILFHHESASRGANKLLDERYAAQTAYFRERWAAALRDDGYFHPALSLDALDLALG